MHRLSATGERRWFHAVSFIDLQLQISPSTIKIGRSTLYDDFYPLLRIPRFTASADAIFHPLD